MEENRQPRDKSIFISMLAIFVVVVLFIAAYYQVRSIVKERALTRMEEGVNTVIEEIIAKFDRDSRILNATADVLSGEENINASTVRETMGAVAPLLQTMRIRVLLPDNSIVEENGTVVDGTGYISFEDEAPLGEHVSNRMTSAVDGNTQVLRHFVPIVRNGETVAMLYGVTILADLPAKLNIDNIYDARASVFIIDAENGDYIMNPYQTDELGNTGDYPVIEFQGSVAWDADGAVNPTDSGDMMYKSPNTGEWQYLYYAPSGLNQWTIAVSVPQDVALSSVYAVRQVVAVMAVIMSIIIVLYYLWLRKNAKNTTARAVERAVLEEKLHKAEAAEKAKTAFLSNMSHDIRTPLNAIVGYTTLAETNLDNHEKLQDYLGKILSSSSHLLSLINDILDMSRIESGKLNLEEKPCSISEIFRDMRNIIQPQMQSKQLNFFMDTMDVVDEDIFCDKLHLNQVLLNLLSNAIKFTPAGGSVSLVVCQKQDAPTGYGSYEIRVKDTGIGMSKEFAEHIFEPFERERTSTVSGIQGTGLGMAITKSIVDAMGGTIDIITEQNKGSEFIIGLQLRLQDAPKQAAVLEELNGLRALVVDDNFATCDSVSKMLTQIGMRAEWTLYGKEALLRAKQAMEMGAEFSAYILDWALPDISGLEVARQIRALVGEKIPIIVLTAYDLSAIEDEARDAGVTAFCNKPIFLSELRQVMAEAVGKVEGKQETEDIFPVVKELEGTKLLVVEDNELNLEIAQELLEESGFIVESASDGTEAVERVRNAKPGDFSLILMDIQMPIMNGYDATRAIRAMDSEMANIPIVAMTANAFEEDRKKALDSGMNAHIAKPVDVDKLLSVIVEQLMGKD